MAPARPAAAVLALVAGHVTGLVHPTAFLSSHAVTSLTSSSAAGAVSRVAGAGPTATITTTTDRNRNTKMVLRPDQCRSSGFIRQTALMLLHRWPAAGAAAGPVFLSRGTSMGPTKNAVQSMSVRQPSSQQTRTTTAVAAVGQQVQVQQGGGPPVGGYPPPEHLHGVFAVYKPKGFSSNDVVQKIKVSETATYQKKKLQQTRNCCVLCTRAASYQSVRTTLYTAAQQYGV